MTGILLDDRPGFGPWAWNMLPRSIVEDIVSIERLERMVQFVLGFI